MNDERDDEQMLAEGRTRFNDETERNDEPEPRVQVLTPSERNAYRGVTIDEKTPDEPTEFEIFFIPDAEFEYRYQLSVQKGKIVKENLYRRRIAPNSRISTLFERSDGEIKLGGSIRKKSINTEVNEQMPYLSFLAINYKIEPINIATKWFELCIIKKYKR